MKLTPAQRRFLARLGAAAEVHVRNGEKATAQALIDRGLLVEVRVDRLCVRWVRRA